MRLPSSRFFVGMAAVSTTALLLVTLLVVSGATTDIDSFVLNATTGWREGTRGDLFYLAALLLYPGATVPVVPGAVLYILRQGGGWRSLLPVLVYVFSTAVDGAIKWLVARPRPAPDLWVEPFPIYGEYSFTSGHAMNSMALYGLLLSWLLASEARGTQRAALGFLFLLTPLVIGLSRVVLGVHWLSDVVGGWLGGLAVMSIVVLFWRRTREWGAD